jgi:hypothetical protein
MIAEQDPVVMSGSSVVAADDSGYSTEISSNNAAAAEGVNNNNNNNNNTSSDSNDSSSTGGGGYDPFLTDEDYDFENVQERIEYICEKQHILQRASAVLLYDDEESYAAATARTSTRTPLELQAELEHQDEYTIWGEAKDILRQISSKAGNETEQVAAVDAVVSRPSGVGLNRRGGAVPNCNRAAGVKRPAAAAATSSSSSSFLNHASSRGQINLTGVSHVASLSFDKPLSQDQQEEKDEANEQQQLAKLPTVALFGKGQWMAQALVWMSSSSSQQQQQQQQQVTEEDDSDDDDEYNSSSNNNNGSNNNNNNNGSNMISPQDCRWKVISDPFTCSLGLVPPSNITLQSMSTVTIDEAISFTSEARLVTQCTPPFCVVFVNRAFLQLIPGGGLKSKESLIGKPVESILLVATVPTENAEATKISTTAPAAADAAAEPFLHCILSPASSLSSSSSSDRAIVACRMQVVPVLDRFRRRRLSTSSYSCMSHLMIRVVPAVDDSITTTRRPLQKKKKVVTIAEILPVVERNQSSTSNILPQQPHGGGSHRGGSSSADKLLGTVG